MNYAQLSPYSRKAHVLTQNVKSGNRTPKKDTSSDGTRSNRCRGSYVIGVRSTLVILHPAGRHFGPFDSCGTCIVLYITIAYGVLVRVRSTVQFKDHHRTCFFIPCKIGDAVSSDWTLIYKPSISLYYVRVHVTDHGVKKRPPSC